MKLTLELNGESYRVAADQPHSLAIPLHFNGPQPNHFGAAQATAQVLEGGGFVGDTSRGGSCNVKTVTLVPHCNGTHTESVSHIVDESVAVGELAQSLIPATLITVMPEHGAVTHDHYAPELEENDKVISKAQLAAELSAIDNALCEALIVRTLPNPQVKMRAEYNESHQPPFFTRDALEYLVAKGVQHLLVDFPSIDKMYDEGLLTNHHIFWQVEEKTHYLNNNTQQHKTVTEMVYISDAINDGHYLLSLNIAPFQSDAAPSRPLLYPLEKL